MRFLPPPPPPFVRRLLRVERWLPLLDRRVPLALKKRLAEPQLNQLFAQAIQEGDFDLLEERYLSLQIRDLDVRFTLTLRDQQLQLVDEPGEATIRGDWRAFLRLALQQEDPDGLFFRRELVVEGDTELGLGVKNLLDGLEWSLQQGWTGLLLAWLQQLAEEDARQTTRSMPA